MNVPEIIMAIGQIDDELIAFAAEYKPKKRKNKIVILRYIVSAACLILVFTAFLFHPAINDEFFSSVFPGNQLNDFYEVAVFEMTDPVEPIQLFAYSVELPAEIREAVVNRYGVNPDQCLSVFDYTDENTVHYWFPIIADGKILSFIYATFGSNGQVVVSSSISNANEFNSIAEKTDAENPVLVVSDGFVTYYIIGDIAYVSPNYAQHCPEFIERITISLDEFSVVKIS